MPSSMARVANTSGPRTAENAALAGASPSALMPRAALMSVMTSSTTMPTAAASPSSVIVVKVVPCRYST